MTINLPAGPDYVTAQPSHEWWCCTAAGCESHGSPNGVWRCESRCNCPAANTAAPAAQPAASPADDPDRSKWPVRTVGSWQSSGCTVLAAAAPVGEMASPAHAQMVAAAVNGAGALEAEVAWLRAGAAPSGDAPQPGADLTPGQWLAHFLELDPEDRLDLVAHILATSAAATRCFEADHEGQIRVWMARAIRAEAPTVEGAS